MAYPYRKLIKPRLGTPIIKGHSLGPVGGLVGCWLFNEGSGNKVFDLSGNGNNDFVFFNSPSWSSGSMSISPAILFDDASSQYLEVDRAILSSLPMTWIVGFSSDDIAAKQTLLWIGEKVAANQWWALQAEGTQAGDPVSVYLRSGASESYARTTTGFSANRYHQAAAVFVSNTERYAYIDGGSVGSDTTDLAPSSTSRTSIGRSGDSTPEDYFSGKIYYIFLYNRVLSAYEIAQLYREPFCMFKDPNEWAVLGGYTVPVVGMAGAMTTNTGYWGW